MQRFAAAGPGSAGPPGFDSPCGIGYYLRPSAHPFPGGLKGEAPPGMLIVMKSGSTRDDVDRVSHVIQGLGFDPQPFPLAERLIVRVAGYSEPRETASTRLQVRLRSPIRRRSEPD